MLKLALVSYCNNWFGYINLLASDCNGALSLDDFMDKDCAKL